MNETNVSQPTSAEILAPPEMARRRFLARLCLSLGGLCGVILGAPLVGFLIAPFFRKAPAAWISAGKVENFEIGKTVSVPYPDPSPLPWAGITAKSVAWLRRDGQDRFTAFSVHCTHMGCPVRWLPDSQLFMCPCHGGIYYADGTVAAGPPPKPLIQYPVEIVNGEVKIKAIPLPITTEL
jgi:menaquinol-cytochrome c reductase iron-sulfur subunit